MLLGSQSNNTQNQRAELMDRFFHRAFIYPYLKQGGVDYEVVQAAVTETADLAANMKYSCAYVSEYLEPDLAHLVNLGVTATAAVHFPPEMHKVVTSQTTEGELQELLQGSPTLVCLRDPHRMTSKTLDTLNGSVDVVALLVPGFTPNYISDEKAKEVSAKIKNGWTL